MDVGTSIAICGGCFSVVAIVFKLVPPRKCNEAHCQDHSGIVQSISGVNTWLKSIDDKVTLILKNGKGQ
jgi:hypothetical protein